MTTAALCIVLGALFAVLSGFVDIPGNKLRVLYGLMSVGMFVVAAALIVARAVGGPPCING